jgi:hypothetical protein
MDDKKEDKGMLTKLKEAVIGTPEQNAEATTKLKAMKSFGQRKAEQEQGDAEKYFGLKKGAGASWDDSNKSVKKMAKGGTASSRADGCAQRGKTKGRMV